MATTENALSGINGTKKKFSFTFPYLKTTDLKVELVRTTTADSTTTTTTLDSTEFTFPTATEVELSAGDATNWQETTGAPKADGSGYTYSGKVYRSTASDALTATFYPGSAIRSADLNDNYTQNLYVTQEANNNVTTATTDAAAAVVTADASTTTAASAVTTANAAVTTANTASTTATTANTTANTANTTAASAVTTANSAVTTANNASTTAASAEAAVSSVLPYTIVADKAALLAASVTQDDIYEVTDTTDLEDLGGGSDVIWVNAAGSTSGQDIAALKPSVTWDSGITLKMKKYGTSDSDRKWIFQSYFANDPETKYAPTASPTFTGAIQNNATITVGVDDTGYDVKFFGDTASAYCLWDTSADDLILAGVAGLVVPDGQLTLGATAVTSTAAELNTLDGFTGAYTDLNYIDVATAGTAEASKAVVLDANLDITGLNDVTIAGDLTVNGTTTTIDTTNLTVEDPLISLAKNNDSADTVDIGFYGLYDATGSQDVYTGLFRDANDSGKWKLFELNQAAPTTTVDVGGTGYAAATLVVGTLEDSKGDVRNIPASTNSTLVAADAGKHISITAGITINASTDFAIGDAVTIFNNQGDGNDETITVTGTTLYLASDATATGNRTLSGRGVATILCVAANTYVITGGGLS